MPAPWGWREWITWASNPVLAVIGVIGICIGIGSLCAISRQVRHIATSERAWLVANIVKVEILNIPSPSPVGAIVRVVNKGKTPGFISEAGGAIEALMTGKSLPDTPIEYLDRNIGRWKGRGMPLVPEDSRGRWVSGEINGANVVWAGASVLWIHGYIKYRDAFGNKIRETRFCFRWIPPSNAAGLGEQFLLDGPSGYNEAT
jgi:hypothetical protein